MDTDTQFFVGLDFLNCGFFWVYVTFELNTSFNPLYKYLTELMEKKTCGKETCAIQTCLQRNNYDQNKCKQTIKEYEDCIARAKLREENQMKENNNNNEKIDTEKK